MASLDELRARLGEENKHVLRFWDELSEEERKRLAEQVRSLDVSSMQRAFVESSSLRPPTPSQLAPLREDSYVVVEELPPQERERLSIKGLEAVSRGEVAALVLAGGQASRLGSDKPKGTIPLGLHLSALDSLLCLQGAKLARLERLAASIFPASAPRIPWLVMTSNSTEEATREHLKKVIEANALRTDQVTIFSQADIPAFDMEGRFLLAEKGRLATAPNGNGGLYSALAPHLEGLAAAGVKYLHVYCVDNVLAKVADPLFVGIAIDRGADCLAKAVKREEPGEKVGVICTKADVPAVVEYSELGEELASKTLPDGRLEYRAGNIANHLFSIDFLRSFATPTFHLPYHRALKKIPFVNDDGETVKPTANNGIKLEQFVFDVFCLSKKFVAVEVSRSEEFSPLKNAESVGTECLSTCRRDLHSLHGSWLRRAGASVPEGAPVIVKPARSYDGEGLEEFRSCPLPEHFIVS